MPQIDSGRGPVRQRVGVTLRRCRTNPSGIVAPLPDRGYRESARWLRGTVDEVGADAVHLDLPLLQGGGSRKTGPGNFSACSFSVGLRAGKGSDDWRPA